MRAGLGGLTDPLLMACHLGWSLVINRQGQELTIDIGRFDETIKQDDLLFLGKAGDLFFIGVWYNSIIGISYHQLWETIRNDITQ